MPSLAQRAEKFFHKVFFFLGIIIAVLQFLFIFIAESFSAFFVGAAAFFLTLFLILGCITALRRSAALLKSNKSKAIILYGSLFLLSFTVRFFLYFLPIGRHIVPKSDYEFAYKVAATSAGVGPYSAVFSHWFFLGKFYQGLFSLLGSTTPQIAYVLNIVIDSFSVLLTFHLITKIVKKQSAAIGAAFFHVFWPSYNVQLNLFSPDPFIVFFLLLIIHVTIIILEKIFQNKSVPALLFSFLLGLLLVGLSLLKPYHTILILAFALVFMVKWLQKKYPKGLLLLFALVLIITLGTYSGGKAFVVHKVETTYNHKLGSPLAYTLRTGFNFATNGGWSPDVADFYFNTLYTHPIDNGFDYERVNQIMKEDTLKQIETNLHSLPLLFAIKLFNAWTNERPIIYALTKQLEAAASPLLQLYIRALITVSQLYYFALVLLCLFSLKKAKDKPVPPSLLLIKVILFGFMLAFLLSEVQPRYRVPLYPLLCILASMELDSLPFLKKAGSFQNITLQKT